jgi:very-short-patch-repair endonuclease
VPLISIWLGDADGCERALAAAGRTMLWSNGTELQAVARDFCRELAARHDLPSEAFRFIARELGETEGELRAGWTARGMRERRMWLAEVDRPPLGGAVDVLRATLDRDVSPDAACALRNLYAWLAPVECLGLREGAAVRQMLPLVIDAPRLPVVASLECDAWRTLLAQLDDRSRALLEPGVLPQLPTEQPSSSVSVGQQVREAYARAEEARRRRSKAAPELASRARSAAEQQLFELLQADAVTRDLFVLNVQMPFSFGTRRAEVDLACVELRVAVEVDGFFHFREFAAYRRDRRKDVLLQHQGYIVSRHLADDVVDRPREVVRTIRELVKRRRRRRRREKAE